MTHTLIPGAPTDAQIEEAIKIIANARRAAGYRNDEEH